MHNNNKKKKDEREGMGTDCQKVSGSWSCKHSGPKPNLNEETDHFARWPMSGHGSTGGLLTVVCILCFTCLTTVLLKEVFVSALKC